MNRTEYEAIPAVNWSALKHMGTSPLQYQHALNTRTKPTMPMRLGSAMHCAILEPDRFAERHPIFPGKKRIGKAWIEFKADKIEANILTEAEAELVIGACAAVMRHPVAGPLFDGGSREQVMAWTDPETGVACKAIADLIGDHHLVELKTTAAGGFDPAKFAQTAARLGYVGQCAFYDDGAREAGHELDDDPKMVVVQSTPPHDVIVYRVAGPVLHQGRMLYQRLLRELVVCRERDQWPGMAVNGELDLVLPAWASEDEDLGPLLIDGVAVDY